MLRLSFLAVGEGADGVDAPKPFDIRLIGNLVRDCLDLYAVSWISEGVSSPISDKLNAYFVKYNLYKIRAIALTDQPTLRWIFQGFQGIHVVVLNGVKQIVNLTDSRVETLNYFSQYCQKYYILSG